MSLDNLLEWYRRLDAYIIPSGEVGQQGHGTIVDGFPVDKRVDTLCTNLWTRLGLRAMRAPARCDAFEIVGGQAAVACRAQ